ncbi:Ltp family lipoprotein [Paenibacillus tritici]|uniref:Ltp family lipoprotein n=1 Tax=Paenibacillus tritici TaxID=1873425 RepID=UPI001FE29D12|nr:Ltp family lipoprotein [Paenibacillus tritici]
MKKPVYKKWWFWVVLIIVFAGIGNMGNDKDKAASSEPAKTVMAEATIAPTAAPSVLTEEEKKAAEEAAIKAEAEKKEKEEAEAKAKIEAEAKEKAEAEAAAKEASIPREYKAALGSAQSYAESMHMSKAGIYEQLTSEYGENFPKEAAKYAIDNIVYDWKENALLSAQSYAEMNMSDKEIYNQLISEYGERFTKQEAQYAIDNLK